MPSGSNKAIDYPSHHRYEIPLQRFSRTFFERGSSFFGMLGEACLKLSLKVFSKSVALLVSVSPLRGCYREPLRDSGFPPLPTHTLPERKEWFSVCNRFHFP